MKVQSSVRTPSARLSSLISLRTRNRRKKALEMRALSSGSCGAQPQDQSGAGAGGEGRQAGRGRVCVRVVLGGLPARPAAPAEHSCWPSGACNAGGDAGWAPSSARSGRRFCPRGSDSAPGSPGAPASSHLLPELPLSRGPWQLSRPSPSVHPVQSLPEAQLLCGHQFSGHTLPRTGLSQAGRPLPTCQP